MDDLEIRRVLAADDAGVRRVREALRAVEGDGDVQLPKADDPWARVAAVGGDVVGFSRVDFWTEEDGTRLYLLSGCVDPAWRRRGIGRELLAHQEAQATTHWTADPGGGAGVLGGNADERRPDTLALLLAAGYRVRFTLVSLARDPAGADDSGELPPGIEVRAVQPGHHPLIHRVLENCFSGTGLGQHAVSYSDYEADIRDEDLWVVAWDGEQIAGLIINNRLVDGSVDTPWVAVPAAWRRKGIAKALLQRSLRLLAAGSIPTAKIDTVVENPNHTVDLYENAGYRIVSRTPRYGKQI